jgi:hypothetical protein
MFYLIDRVLKHAQKNFEVPLLWDVKKGYPGFGFPRGVARPGSHAGAVPDSCGR